MMNLIAKVVLVGVFITYAYGGPVPNVIADHPVDSTTGDVEPKGLSADVGTKYEGNMTEIGLETQYKEIKDELQAIKGLLKDIQNDSVEKAVEKTLERKRIHMMQAKKGGRQEEPTTSPTGESTPPGPGESTSEHPSSEKPTEHPSSEKSTDHSATHTTTHEHKTTKSGTTSISATASTLIACWILLCSRKTLGFE